MQRAEQGKRWLLGLRDRRAAAVDRLERPSPQSGPGAQKVETVNKKEEGTGRCPGTLSLQLQRAEY
jgi:hypothetical protein